MDENMESLSEIRRLTPEVVHMMDEMLHSNKIPAMVKVRLMVVYCNRIDRICFNLTQPLRRMETEYAEMPEFRRPTRR